MSEFSAFSQFLATRLQQTLPGFWAQVRMAPLPADGRAPGFNIRPDAKVGAVLALLVPNSKKETELLYTLRRADMKSHAGQISFPGGRQMPEEDLMLTALRETHEEIGLAPERITVLGKLTPLYIPPTNNYVHPYLGTSEDPDPLVAEPAEVEEIFRVTLAMLYKPESRIEQVRKLPDGLEHRVPAWQIHSRVPLWGATAMMTAELIALYEEFRTS
jgi:8-oxo-dGTP pyrophosphatase MutT (NUDIX family)